MRATISIAVAFMALGCSADKAPPESSPARVPEQSAQDPAGEPEAKAVAQAPQLLSDAELAEGWISLFDGHSLFGWQATSDANWRVEEGTIVVDSGEKGFLCTTTEFCDYELRVEFKSEAETNSGVFLRTGLDPGDVSSDCYELNIAPPSNPFPTGSLVLREKVEVDCEPADWHEFHVTVTGAKVHIALDGATVLDYEDPNPVRRGRIALQLNEGRVAFRSVQLRPIGLTAIFNGQDLSGWQPSGEGEFTVEDGLMRVRGGRGQLETADSYADFVLQLQCRVNAPELNSGIFFRCIPGDEMMGYESQISNAFADGDRAQPLDHGTGGIFRRVNARLVVADDLNWFHKTLIADGPHVAVWVNGYQVTDWIDERSPDPNPRRGQRLEAGSIMIQAHDPTTDFSFRGILIGRLAR